MRTIAIGDIHGCAKALRTLLERIEPQPDDTLIFLGDYVDRGPDSRDVIEQILELSTRCQVIALRGNHEIMLMGVMLGGLSPDLWLACGGQATVSSYGGAIDKMPVSHRKFLSELTSFHETDDAIFVHANYLADTPMDQQAEQHMFWEHLGVVPPPHQSGKRVFVGHTPQPSGNILDHGHLVCLDTCCFGGLWLTAMDIHSGDIWQTDFHGHERRQRWRELARAIGKWSRKTYGKLTSSPSKPAP
ncbi:metallophosphoesterase family protein [Roseimaritima ulvae]|uniref:Serine/threonine-protein phosphatase 1 n=1 Tax=Roseimaritima ulvae TaxID=980254 RepID=A0A5B9R7I8_9BACT|nr:metallophosphoesterase family protein [Roseimaritima ulvae]QEG42413.1 Serine/threonine-protein phosphatase 1 [Roseimaritima ulvae]